RVASGRPFALSADDERHAEEVQRARAGVAAPRPARAEADGRHDRPAAGSRPDGPRSVARVADERDRDETNGGAVDTRREPPVALRQPQLKLGTLAHEEGLAAVAQGHGPQGSRRLRGGEGGERRGENRDQYATTHVPDIPGLPISSAAFVGSACHGATLAGVS